MKSPSISEVRHSKKVVQRWNYMAKARGKTSAIVETQRILDLLDYLEKHGKLSSY